MLPQQTMAFLARGTQFKTGCKKTADYADYADNNGLVMLYSQLSRICTIGPQPDALVSALSGAVQWFCDRTVVPMGKA